MKDLSGDLTATSAGVGVRSAVWKWGWRFHFCATFRACQEARSRISPSHRPPQACRQEHWRCSPLSLGLVQAGLALQDYKNSIPGVFYCESVESKNWQLNTNWDFLGRKNISTNINCNPIVLTLIIISELDLIKGVQFVFIRLFCLRPSSESNLPLLLRGICISIGK